MKTSYSIAGLALVVLALWVASAFGIAHYIDSWEHRGQFGDMFGAVNALFSALAFAGVVYTVYLQQVQMERTSLETQKATHANAFVVVYGILQTDELRASRGIVMHELKKKPLASWTPAEIKHAESVCQSYDSIGIMCRNDYISVSSVADSWGDSLRRCWEILCPLVEKYQDDRKSYEFWDDFAWLAEEAQKYKKPERPERRPRITAVSG